MCFFFFQAEDGIRDDLVTGVQTCALPIFAAGLGEELMMRGVLQPRFGWLLPNLAFTAAHALQYNLDALVGVFVAGAVLALMRARWSTSEGIVAHALYDLVQF